MLFSTVCNLTKLEQFFFIYLFSYFLAEEVEEAEDIQEYKEKEHHHHHKPPQKVHVLITDIRELAKKHESTLKDIGNIDNIFPCFKSFLIFTVLKTLVRMLVRVLPNVIGFLFRMI